MATNDTAVSIHPYFVIHDEPKVRSYLERFVEMTDNEEGCQFYGFSINGDKLFCRESYVNGEAALVHLGNVGPLLGEMLESGAAELATLQVHGPEAELAKVREPFSPLNPDYWVLEYGFRK